MSELSAKLFGATLKVIETAVKLMPAPSPDPLSEAVLFIGKP